MGSENVMVWTSGVEDVIPNFNSKTELYAKPQFDRNKP